MADDPEFPRRKHLTRLRPFVNQRCSVYYISMNVKSRRNILTESALASVVLEALYNSLEKHGWAVGAYAIMPDHIHFLCYNVGDKKSLSEFIRDFKRWTSGKAKNLGYKTPLWQREFFDHLIRKNESYYEKMEYIEMNPVKAGFCETPEQWKYTGRCHPLIEG